MATNQYIFVQVAVGNADQAWEIAKAVVKEKVAACAQILPMRSCYEWQGEVTEDDEYLVFIKSKMDVYEKLEACVRAKHSYDVPEIIAIPIVAGSRDYLQWIDTSLKPADK